MARFIDADKLIDKIKEEGMLGTQWSELERENDIINMIEECVLFDGEYKRI